MGCVTPHHWDVDTDGVEVAAISATLDTLHEAAAHADEPLYFSLFAPNAVFLRTDPSERWTMEHLRTFAHPFFSRGFGWTYVPRTRRIFVSGTVGWFDEVLDSAPYGECRGTGVLMKYNGAWRIMHYSLTIPIPNQITKKVVELIRAHPAPSGR